MSNKPLKNCPFCGGEAELKNPDGVAWVVCRKCRTEIRPFYKPEEAIKLWNTRVPMEKIVGKLEEEKIKSQNIYNGIKDSFYLGMIQASDNAIEIVKEEGGLCDR